MEDICIRFPEISELVFKNLDNESLAKCRLVSRKLKTCIDEEKVLWLRIIQKYYGDLDKYPGSEFAGTIWKMVLDKTPTEIIKELAITVRHFFQQKDTSEQAVKCLLD